MVWCAVVVAGLVPGRRVRPKSIPECVEVESGELVCAGACVVVVFLLGPRVFGVGLTLVFVGLCFGVGIGASGSPIWSRGSESGSTSSSLLFLLVFLSVSLLVSLSSLPSPTSRRPLRANLLAGNTSEEELAT